MTLNEIKMFILSMKDANSDEVEVDDVVNRSPYERNSVMAAMKGMQTEKLGQFIIGRKKAKSRFRFGAVEEKVVEPRVVVLATALKRLIGNKSQQEPDTQIIINVDDLVSKFAPKDITCAFQILEAEEIGRFIIGRKGAKSRFEVGRKREEVIRSKTSGSEYDLPCPEVGPFSSEEEKQTPHLNGKNVATGCLLRVASNIVFLMNDIAQGYASIDEAISNSKFANLSNQDKIVLEKNLIRFGYVAFE